LAKRGENSFLHGDAALVRANEHFKSHEDVWLAGRLKIAEHWAKENPPMPQTRPSEIDRDTFVTGFSEACKQVEPIAVLRLIEKCSA
jgi:hypothetical protein